MRGPKHRTAGLGAYERSLAAFGRGADPVAVLRALEAYPELENSYTRQQPALARPKQKVRLSLSSLLGYC